MQECNGDIRTEFLNEKWDAICCTINTCAGRDGLVMGAGIALAFKQQYHWLPLIWGERITRWDLPKTYIIVTRLNDRPLYAVGFPTKRDWRFPSEINLIKRSAQLLRFQIEAMDWRNVLLPRPGCANGGLQWENVKPMLDAIFDDRVTIISKE